MKNILVLLVVILAITAHPILAVPADSEKPGSAGLRPLLPRLPGGECYTLEQARAEFAKNPESCASYGKFLFDAYPQLLDHAVGTGQCDKFLSLFDQSEGKRVTDASQPILGYNSGLLNGEIFPTKDEPEPELLPLKTRSGTDLFVAVHKTTGIIWLKLDCGNLYGSGTTWTGEDTGLTKNPWTPPPPPPPAPKQVMTIRQAPSVPCPTNCPAGPAGPATFVRSSYKCYCHDGRFVGRAKNAGEAAILIATRCL